MPGSTVAIAMAAMFLVHTKVFDGLAAVVAALSRIGGSSRPFRFA